ncbi:MAG: [FeFe] hydrogenase, group A [Oscillospiraceae bacterium]|nr:[FeFe] hydrogenase, group A [Oscillospiraceae bacterium]
MSTHKFASIRIPIEEDNPSIMRIEKLCTKCGTCRQVCENDIAVGKMYDLSSTGGKAICVHCGQCSNMCPTGSITEKYEYQEVQKAIESPDKVVIFNTSPSVRVGLGEEFGLAPGTFVEGKLVAALRALGADYVLDTNFSADLTIMEEASELVDRIKNHTKPLPQFTSCCPSWVKFTETFFPDKIPHISSAKSPIGMQGPTVKTYFAKAQGINPAQIVNVAVTPCTSKKFEIRREEMCDAGLELGIAELRDMDHVITTRELALWLREKDIDFNSLMGEEYDKIMGAASGAGVIFGNTGGVMEAAARTAYFMIMGEKPGEAFFNLQPVRGMDGIRSATVNMGGVTVRLAVVHGLENARRVLEDMDSGKCEFDFLEVMCCRGGCIGGGGQPKALDTDLDKVREARIKSLYQRDSSLSLRTSHENPEIKAVYAKHYDKPLSHLAERLLHTEYRNRSADLGVKGKVEKKASSKVVHIIVDVLMLISLLVALVSPSIIRVIRWGGGAFPEWSFYRELHMFAGWAIAILIVVHIVINYRQILAVGSFFSVPTVTKIQYIVMCLMLVTMVIAVVTGAIWGNQGLDASHYARAMHGLTAWLAFLFTGIHTGFNASKLMSYMSLPKKA